VSEYRQQDKFSAYFVKHKREIVPRTIAHSSGHNLCSAHISIMLANTLTRNPVQWLRV